ncbi:MAG: family 20 glycosylhydrolase [Planctomycetota bacterium]
MSALPPLLPFPRTVERRGGSLTLPHPTSIAGDPGEAALARLGRALDRTDVPWRRSGDAARATIAFEPAEDAGEPEAYRLSISTERAVVRGAPRGLAHGASTLAQLVRCASGGGLPCLVIDDAPSFAHRGAMLDVSRDRVPTMETLFELVELFAGWKLNHLQLYTEHTFAFAGHETVWRDASPLTPAEIRELDAFCRARGIELVPNQQCFGHMHRWLRHERYRPLAEVPAGVKHPFAVEAEPFSLCPGDPGSLALIEDLLDQLLPCFESAEVNVGLDETFDLGEGRSKELCAERGVGRVYLDFLLAVHERVAARGKRMQFWADVLLHRPEHVTELPRDCVPMLWGYEADHPFEREADVVAASGLDFFVCPGTSSWQSIAGRTDNMLANVASAARHGARTGASGLLVTDWGDRGHLQPLPVSYAGWARAADLSWNAARADEGDDDLAARLDVHALDGEGAARVALELGRVERAIGSGAGNGNAPFFLLAMIDERVPCERTPDLTREGVERGLEHLARATAGLADAELRRPDAELVRRELAFCSDLLEVGLRLGAARLAAPPEAPASALPTAVRAELSERLRPLVDEHRELWLARCRPGGLADSAGWLERVLRVLA